MEKNENTPTIITSFTGAYTTQDLTKYLDLLTNKAGDVSFALNLISNMHAITLTFDSKTKLWTLIDPNHLPTEDYMHSKHVADALFRFYKSVFPINLNKAGVLVMGTQMTTTKRYQQQMQLQFEKLAESSEWNELHEARKNFADDFRFTPSTLYTRLYDDSQEDSEWGDDTILDKALEAGLNDIIIEYAIANGIDIFLYKNNSSLGKILPILPTAQQLLLLDKLSAERRAAIVEAGAMENRPKFFQMLPEQEQIPFLLQTYTPNSYLSGLSAEKLEHLFNQLSFDQKINIISRSDKDNMAAQFRILSEQDKPRAFLQMDPGAQSKCLSSLATEQRSNLWNKLSSQQKTDIIVSSETDNLISIFQILPEKDQLPTFLELSPQQQCRLLLGLDTSSLKEQQKHLIKELSIKQKAGMLAGFGDAYDNYSGFWATRFMFFQLLSMNEQLELFQKLTNAEQSNLLARLAGENMTELRSALIIQLSTEQKAEIAKQWYHQKIYILQTIPEEEYLLFFLKLSPKTQCDTLDELIRAERTEDVSALLEQLSLEQKINIIKHSMAIIAIFNSIPENERFEVLEEKTAKKDTYNATLKYYIEGSSREFLSRFMNCLSINGRYHLIQQGVASYETLRLPALKTILQDKITEEIVQAGQSFVFDKIKQQIANARDVYELDDLISELNHLLEHHQASNELINVDMTA